MSKEQVIEQLKSLKAHCEDFSEEDNIFAKDVEALDYAIKVLEGAV